MSLRAGSMNRLVRVEKHAGGKDALNRPINDWVLHREIWVDWRAQTGMGVLRAGSEGVNTTLNAYSLRTRYAPDILSVGFRVVYAGVSYDIVDIRHDIKGKEYTDIILKSGNSG